MTPEARRHRTYIGRALIEGRLPFDYKPESSMDLKATVAGTAGPYFSARWRPEANWGKEWPEEQYRLFRNAKDRIDKEYAAGCHMAYVQHLPTEETVYSVGPSGVFEQLPFKNWWDNHSPECGTKYRGCAPSCPKDRVECYAAEMVRDALRKEQSRVIEGAWPSEFTEKQMLADAQILHGHEGQAGDAAIHIQALLQRVRELERTLAATGYFRDKEQDGRGHFKQWVEAVSYTEEVDASLDGLVPTQKGGQPIWLKERVAMLVELCLKQARELTNEKRQEPDHPEETENPQPPTLGENGAS